MHLFFITLEQDRKQTLRCHFNNINNNINFVLSLINGQRFIFDFDF